MEMPYLMNCHLLSIILTLFRKKTYEDEIKNLKNEVDILQQEKDAILRR